MLMIAISIVFSIRSTASPSQNCCLFSRISASLSVVSIFHSLQKRKEHLIHAAKLLNIKESAKQNNRFFHIALADICCRRAD